jgi:hypothetical protein
MNMQQMLGESGRAMSNRDREIMDMMMRNTDPVVPPSRLPLPDNEPRFEDRSPENQMFSIDTAIGNLMTEYDMVVRNKEFERAQMIADQIDQLQQQKIGIQGMNARRQMVEDNFLLPPSPIPPERGKPPQEDEISRILDSISI